MRACALPRARPTCPRRRARNGTYRAAGSLSGPRWKIQLSGLPSLTFAAPSRATSFVADLYDGKVGGGGGPSLYKELRLTGASTGPGTHYRLILQGRGNNCLVAEDFTHWRLEVTGGKRKLRLRRIPGDPGSAVSRYRPATPMRFAFFSLSWWCWRWARRPPPGPSRRGASLSR